MEAAPALVPTTMYFVAGGDGCDGVPGRGDIRVRELGTLMMLGVRGPVDPLNPLCETVRVGRGCANKKQPFSVPQLYAAFLTLCSTMAVWPQLQIIYRCTVLPG